MPQYEVLTIESAPEQSRSSLQQLQKAFGFLPNIAGALANSPTLINSLASVFAAVHGSNLSEAEIQVLLLTNAVTNKSAWPVAFHSTLALKLGVEDHDVENIRQGRNPDNTRYKALSVFARALIETRGHVEQQHTDAMKTVGFSPEQVLSVIAVTAASTITNYGASLTDPPLEAAFQPNAWGSTS